MPSMAVRTAGPTALGSPSQSDREANILSSRSFSSFSLLAHARSIRRFARDEQWSSGQRRHILQILTTLLGAPSVAGLVLGRDQRVRAAASFSREVKVADCAPDLLFNMAPPSL